ncbi:MFS transporter [Pseudonocardia sp.]|uniref:MFS transporter n=1 Tax=Pseudonocardia sp. TaxID=60912 RepID=UPI002606753E|nr:MFS transporter [Pseudonocardia sp.]
MVGWALLADSIPLYPLYALLFADTGLTDAEISALFAIWGAVGLAAEVPSGALADRYSRRSCLVVAGLLQAGGFALWVTLPGFAGFAAGFVAWALGGALISGAQEALLYDGLAAVGAEEHYARVQGRVVSAELLSQVPATLAATALYALGGYPLVGWVSVGVALGASAFATLLPEPARTDADDGGDGDGYVATLVGGVREAAASRPVRTALVAAAVVGGFDAVDEYFPLLAQDQGVPVELVPSAMLVIAVAGAAGAACGGVAMRLPPWALGLVFGGSLVLFGGSGLLGYPAGLVVVAVFYGLYCLVLVVVDARLQERIDGSARATVTSVAGFGVETVGLVFFGVWAAGGPAAIVGVWLLAALALPWWLRARPLR